MFSGQRSLNAEDRPQDESGFVLPEEHETGLTNKEKRGSVLYGYYCALCHGDSGKGDGFNSFSLSTAPAEHADASYMDTLSDSYIRMVIKNGGASQERSPLMPSWGAVLNDKQISYLITFIRTLAQSKGPEEQP
ncbi:MAG: cytochrome c [Desulfobacterales bacterium]